LARRRLIWRIYLPYLLITLVGLLVVSAYSTVMLRDFHYSQVRGDLDARARLIAGQVQAALADGGPPAVDLLCKSLRGPTRITVILPSGAVAGDSEEDPAAMDNHADRPEVASAMAGRADSSVRFSHTLRRRMMYVALPLERSGGLVAVLRTSVSVSAIDAVLGRIHTRTSVLVLAVAAVAAVASFLISHGVTGPLDEMRRGAERFAAGDFSRKIALPDAQETARLADALNRMASQLDERIATVIRQRSEQEAVLSSMAEGVLAVDSHERVLSVNDAAAGLLGIRPREAVGRSIEEVARNSELQRLVSRVLAGQTPVEGEARLSDAGERVLQVRGTVLCDANGESMGAVIVLNDVTRLRRLEDMRRDFVANVSHELKTPVTVIKGAAETLLEGTDDTERARRFLETLAGEADRLDAIISDLLALSRLEQEAEASTPQMEDAHLRPILDSAVRACEMPAAEAGVRVEIDCPDSLAARVNPRLLERAVANLVDNAVKYSPSGTTVCVGAVESGPELVITVADQGCGIAEHHLPRIFERFYRVDKSRSRKLGGTGLGLSIVKHIAQAHGGRTSVDSSPGEGSTFRIHLPKA